MNETVVAQPAAIPMTDDRLDRVFGKGRSGTFYGYASVVFLLALGWLVRDFGLIDPKSGVGYWLGIVGGSVMLFLLLYPLRKRYRFLHIFGSTRQWFRLHMVLGIVGPLMILYHCNFRLGSFNSRVALYCMLLVALSGIIGKHFYSRIHNGLYGRKTSLKELQHELAASRESSSGMARIMPEVTERLDRLSAELQGCAITQSLGVRRSLKWAMIRPVVRVRLRMIARKELASAACRSESIRRNHNRLARVTSDYIDRYVALIGRVAQFSFYERLFALWHVFHLPFFFMLVLSALTHVLAVHMY